MNILNRLRDRFFPPFVPLPTGMFSYIAPPDASFPYRLHLRLEPDGRGLLIANGSTVLHLNQTAAEYAYHLVIQTPVEDAVKTVARRYGIPNAQAEADYTSLVDRLHTMINTPDLDPVAYLDFERVDPYSGALSAPYRIDCALTYRQQDAAADRYAPVQRVTRELKQAEWEIILKKAWDAGIPHVVFTGGEPSLRVDLIDLIMYASNLGMVTGLISDGLRLAERDYLHAVLQSGLDHLMLILYPNEEQSWEALRDTLAEDLAVTVHLTLTPQDNLEDGVLLDRLVKMGINTVSLSAAAPELLPVLPRVRQLAADRQLHLVWDLPVPYSSTNPVALELLAAQERPNQTRGAWIYVEPDGDILSTQGQAEVLGNLLTTDWESIWKASA
jgi:hypothetical protein